MSLLKVSRTGSVAILELQNGKVNALSNALMAEMAAALSALASDSDVGAIVIRGSNKAFSGTPYVHMQRLPCAHFPLMKLGLTLRSLSPSTSSRGSSATSFVHLRK